MNPASAHVLIVEDSDPFRHVIVEFLTQEGFEVEAATTADEALQKAFQTAYDVLITDFVLPDGNGIDILDEVKHRYPETIAIVMTGHATVETAVDAMKRGACDYLIKPFNIVQLGMMIQKGLEQRRLRVENQYLRRQLNEKYSFHNIVGGSSAMKRVFERVEAIAGLSSTVLIQGETGTGKELIAKAIHFNSPRRDQKLVSINCAAIPENLLESELFGHMKGAFTGALQTRIGRFEQAHGGTLFLDEIGAMPLPLQVKLLRVIQEREFERLGGNSPIKVDIRIVAATSAVLKDMVSDGSFREDLYYRLNVIPIDLPALRERREDIPLLLTHFAQHFCAGTAPVKKFSPEVTRALMAYDWPGNIRQLSNIVERTVALTANRQTITLEDLPEEMQSRAEPDFVPIIDIPEHGIDLPRIVTDMERQLILQGLRKSHGNKKLAAKLLNLKRTTLIEKIKRIHIDDDLQEFADAELEERMSLGQGAE
jgi:DNA-binding NtrC family response regulator